MNLDITFERSPLEELLEEAQCAGTVAAERLLPLLEGEEDAQEVLSRLEEAHITLDITALPAWEGSDAAAVRLRREAELVHAGTLLTALDEHDPLLLYLNELAAIPTCGDPELLAQEMLAGNEQAAQSLANSQLYRVLELAQAAVGRGVLLLDLIQEGSLGLWQGILHYTGGPIEEHCRWWIGQYLAKTVLLQALAGGLGQKLRQGMGDYVDIDRYLLGQLGRNPTLEELAEAMHITPQQAAVYEDMVSAARSRAQTDSQRQEPEPTPDDEQAVEDTAYFQSRQRIMELLSVLPERQQELLTLRYGLSGGVPLKPEQVGLRLNMTAEEVNEAEAAALKLLRQNT